MKTGGISGAFVLLGTLSGLAALLAGCGGSSSPGTSPPPAPQLESSPFYFLGDLVTGQVIALTPGDPRISPSADISPQVVGTNTGGGAPLEVQSSNLFNVSGNPGRRAVNLKIVSHLSESVGRQPGGATTGLDLIFTSLVFKNAGGIVVNGGSAVLPDKYDPRSRLPIYTFAQVLAAGASTANRAVVFSVPSGATQAIWGVIVRTDSALGGAYPLLGTRCYVTTIAGNGIPGMANGAADVAQFYGPYGLHVSPTGAILVADSASHALREITPDGMVRNVSLITLPAGTPTDVSVDEVHSTAESQIVYLSLTSTARVLRIVRNPVTNVTVSVTTIAGAGASPEGASGADLLLTSPLGLDCDRGGGFWVADASGFVYRLAPRIDADPRTAPAAQYLVFRLVKTLAHPWDCSVDDAGNVFVVEAESDSIVRIDTVGNVTVIPTLTPTPVACTVNPAGTVCYFKDSALDRIIQFRLTGANPLNPGAWTKEAITAGGSGYLDGPGSTAKFLFSDSGLALDRAGSLYLTDSGNHCVRRIDRLAGE